MILAKQLSELLSVPLFLLDLEGCLLHYNQDAATLLGERVESEGERTRTERVRSIRLFDEDGAEFATLEEPILSVLKRDLPENRRCWVRDRVSGLTEVELTAFPIRGLTHETLGVMALLYPVTV